MATVYAKGKLKKKKSNGDTEIRIPHAALETIYAGGTTASEGTAIADGSRIKSDYLPASAVYTTGGTVASSVIPALTAAYISGGTFATARIPQLSGAFVSGFVTSAKNAASTYVHSAGVIPQSAVSGLTTLSSAVGAMTGTVEELQEDGWVKKVHSGDGIVVTSSFQEYTVGLADYQTINTNTTGATVTILPGRAYKIDATTSSKTLAINSFDVGKWGREAHLELFVANTGYVHTGSNVTLVDPLEPDAVNNCTVRFHDGHAIISVEDHVEAYMVNDAGATNTSGTLLYGLGQTGDTYKFIGFRSELNGSVISTGSGAPTVVKHIVGNGMDVGPTISGSISVANGATLRDLKVSNLNLTSGSLFLGEVAVVSGSTVGATSASAILKLQHVAGEGRIYANSNMDLNGAQIDCYVQAVSGIPTISTALQFGGSGTLDLNGTKLTMTTANASVYISGMTCTGGGLNTSAGGFALIQSGATATFSNCLITGNTSTTQGGGVYLLRTSATFDGCSFVDNDAVTGQGAYIANSATLNLVNCNFTHARGTRAQNIVFGHATASATIAGVCKFTAFVSRANASTSGTLIISSGAVIDLSGNSISVPVIPGGKIIVDGGCTVVNSAGVDVHINGGTYTQIDNQGTAS